ncbi:InlB B-repeat-containing protein [Flavonifractor sp. An9]|uniref:InlB B-repeat-containing protein n=1 Tax=Flavonifractor sp. An9 TaxID=1965664 RepID=UPI000B37275E|nr:S-layer homology domain-containing protein [Flavonifractor sp. An9]OUN13486.1 hypothetical protein B5G40_00365 [Flavonifractor sp. An9]
MKKRILAAFVSLCLLVSLMPGMTLPAAAAGSSQFDSILNMGQPSEFDPNSTENPYGYAVDQPFLMNEMSELGIYGINSNGNYHSFLWYDGWDGESDSIPSAFGKDGVNGSFSQYEYYNDGFRALSFVEAVAFDPTGSGRKDHIAYIGFDTGSNKIVLHVQDAENGAKYANYEFPGNAGWIKNNNPENWRAGNYFDLTAGDFDGDGKETVVAFVTADNANDYGLYEVSCSSTSSSLTVSQKAAGKSMLHWRYVNENHGIDMANTTDQFGNKLCCDLAAGDFNGDGVDDLVAVSYLMAPPDANKHFDCEYYLPMMGVSYGGTASSPVTDGGRQSVFVAVDNGISSGRRSYQTMTAVGLDAGDVDGDGTDEIVVGGTRNTVTSKANSADAGTAYALDGETWNIAVFNARSDGSFASPGTDDSVTRFHTIAATGWFAGGTGGENSRSPLSLACVAFNGNINAEYVFVGGKIVDFSTGGARELYTVSFVKDNDDSIQSTVCDETFIPSVAVGNFDGNDYGYEQIFFVYANRQRYEDDYFYRLGAVGGKNYDGEGGGVGSAGGTDTSMFYAKSSGFFIGGNNGQGGAGAEGHWNYNTNFVLLSMDRDDDGVLARYKGKDWTYTDPQVAAVLQMAPYFDGIDLGSDSGETTYSFTQSYEYTTGTGNETSFGVGFTGEMETNVSTVELQAGSSNTWTETFEETLTTSTTDSFATKAYDSVVLQRTPVITYTYELYDKDKGGWSWDNLESTKAGVGFAISVPKTPAYVQMSVVDYNTFVDEYNALMEEEAEGEKFTPMVKIDGQRSYLGQEGNPWGYASNLDQISSSNYQLGYNGGETQSTKSDGSATTESIESQSGFSFEMSIMAGLEIFGNGAKAGAYASLEYMHSNSSSTTTASETETSGAVQNLDWQYLLEEYGIPENVTKSYGFTWNLARDTIDLGVAGKDALIIAYNVSNISAPAPAVNDLAAELQGLDSVHLTWSDPRVPGRLAVLGYNVYVRSEDEDAFRKVNEEPLDSSTLEYTVTGLDSNTEYTFVVTTDSENGESVWSNEAVITTPKAYVPLTIDYNENEVSVKAVHLGNVEIHSGDKVEEETIVYVDVEPEPGYTVTEVTLETEDGTETVTPVDGQFNFAIQKATTITVTAAVVAEESIVTYTADDANGTVSATVNGEAFPSTGATFGSDDEIIFTAAPADGYALKEWKVTDGSGTDKTYAAAGNTFTFHAYAAEHHVSAVFVPMAEVAKTVTLNVTAGGSIIVKDGDTVLTPDENGKISVPKGTTLTFEAEADRYYTFENWTDAFADYKNDVTSISLKIDNDVTVGAVFESFLAYTLTYGTQSVDGGSGTLTAEANGIAVQSGTTLTPGTTVDFDAEAGSDSRIQKWAVTENGITSFKELDSLGIVTEDAYQLILRANSNVEAAFKTIEKYDLTGSAFGGNGTVTVQRGSGTVNSGTDVLRYYDDLTITLVPNKGYVITQYPDLDGTDTYSYTVSDVTADVDVNYTWTALNQYSVTYSVVDTVGDGSGTHGTISAAAERKGMKLYDDSKPSVVYEDGTITFTAAPDEGYRVKEWIVNGVVQPETGNTLTLTPMQDLNVTVQYTSGLPKVSFADPAHGTLTAKMGEYSIESGAAVSGPVTFTVVPDEHYEVKCWTVNGVEQPGETGNTFTYAATDDCTVAVELWGVEQQVTLRTGTGGTASATDPARYGETITITATPDDGYVVDAITIRGADDVLYENTARANGVQTAEYLITADTAFTITFARKPVVTFSVDNGSLTASGTADGVAAELKSGDYVDFGSAVTFTAVADSGYSLEGWYVDGAKIEHTDLTYTTGALSDNVNVEARFAAIAGIAVNYGVNDDAMGTITATADGRGFQSGDQLSGGQKIVFTVSPAEGYRVKDWTGLPADAQISADKTTVTVPVLTPGTWNVTANLEAIPQYTVIIEETTHGSITAAVDGQPLNSGDTVPDGTQVTFTATADDYWMLKEWTGDASGSDKTITLTVGSDITVGATFTEALLYEVEYSVVGGNGTASGMCEDTPIAADTAVQFAGGSEIQFTATPNSGYMVKAWTINGEVVEGNLTNTLTIDALGENTTVTVEFETYQGFAVPAGGEGYTVTIDQRNPADTYPGAPENEIRRGGDVTFTVAPTADSAIKTVTVAREDATITPNGDGTVTVFIPNVQEKIGLTVDILAGIPLTIETAENGTVTVTRDGVALKSGVKVVAGDKLVITGQPDSGYRLSTLTVNGKNFASGSTYTVAETDTALTVAATFEVQSSGGGGGGGGGGVSSYKITVEDSDHGTVVADRNSANADTTVTLTVTPDDGYRLDSLTVTQQDGKTITLDEEKDGTYTFTMPDSAVTVKAAFTEVTQIELPFVDVPADIWYEDGVYYVYRHGLMDGTSSITFSPDMTTTRSMVATILWRLEGSPVVDYAVPFDDVDLDSWYGEAVRWAASEGIITGYGNNKFGPDDLITREQMATMLHRYAQYKGYDVSIGENTNILSYTDAADVGEYAIPAMQWAVGAEIINGTSDHTLSPEGDATRAEVAVILMRFCEGLVDE